jgi:uncharacterized protein (TIGR02246 family)
MRTNLSRLALAFALVALSACKCMSGADCAAMCALTDKDKAAISAGSETWLKAVRAADWNAVAARYATDAMLMPPNQPVVPGRENIRQWFAAFPRIVSFDLKEAEVDGRCDIAFVRGSYTMTFVPPGAPQMTESGKYLEIHRREPDGSWVILRDMFSADSKMPR